MKCTGCGGVDFSPRVAAVIVVSEFLPNGHYVLVPDSDCDYRLCENDDCSTGHSFTQKAIEAHAAASVAADQWTKSVIIFADGSGWTMRCERPEIGHA